MTAFSSTESGELDGGIDSLSTSVGKLFGKLKNLKTEVKENYNSFKQLDESICGSDKSLLGYIKYTSNAEDATEAFGLSTMYARARVLLLNAALSAGVVYIASYFIGKFAEASNGVETLATQSKEAADAAQNTTSSLKDLVSAYEELGDKSGWDTSDFDQAKDLQEELLDLAKEQGTLDEAKVNKIDFQNGKYQEQLAILKDITSEQLKATQKELVQSKDAQGTKLVQTAKKNNRSHWLGTIWSNVEMQMGDQIKNAGIDIFNWAGGYGADDINDADSIVDYYNNLGKAIEYIIDNTTDEERAVNGKYHALYQFLMDERNALKDDVDSYTDSISALKQNQFDSDFAEWSANEAKKSTQVTAEIDAKIKATKEYQDAVKEAQETEDEWNSQGYGKYGNIDNFHRDKIDWTDENLAKYKDFVDEQNSIFPGTIEKGSYSTVLGSWDTLSDEDGTEHPFAFTPMLQTDDGLVPLTEDQLWNYIDTLVEQCYDEDGKIDVDKLLQLDATGLDEDINGVMMRVKGMIAGIEGAKDPNGGVYSAADVLAQSGDSNEDIKNDLIDLYGPDADLTPVDDNGNLSRYVDKSMHDAQAVAQEGKDNIEAVYDQLYNDLENGPSGESDGSNSAAVRYVDHIQSAFEILADSLGKDSGEMTISDVVGLSQDGVQLTEEQASAMDTLTAAANRYGTTIQGVAEAGEGNGLFGGVEDATNRAAETAKEMETISQQIDSIQKAYKSCSTAVDEYNKYGYMSADSLQSLLTMDYEYLSCLELVNGKLQLNNEAFAQMVASKYADAKVTAVQNALAEIQKISLDDVKTSTEKATEAMDGEVDKLNELSPGLGDAIKGTVGLATAQELLNAAEEKSETNPDRVQTILNGLNTQLSVIDSTIDTILGDSSKIKNHLNGFNKNNKSSSTSKSVTDVASAFDTLTKAMKEYNQYGYISADTMKSMMKLDDKFTSCLVKNGDKLEINANEFRKLVESQLKEEEASGKASKSADELKRVLSYLDNNVHSSTISFEQLTDAIKGYGSAMDEAKEKTDAIKSAFSGLYEVMNNKTDMSNPFGLLDSDDVEKQHEALLQLANDTDVFDSAAYNPETGKVDFNSEAFKDTVVKYLNDMANAAASTGGAGAKALEKNWRDAATAIAEGKISVEEFYNGLGSSLDKATELIDDFQSGFSDIKDVVEEYNTYGGLSIDNYQKLMALSPEYLACLKLEGDQLMFNEGAYKKLLIDKLDDLINTYRQADATKDLANRLEELRNGLEDSKVSFTGATDSAKNFETTLSNIKSLLSDLISVFEQFNTDKSDDLKIQGDAWLEVIDERIDALNEQNDAQERAIELSKAQDALDKAKANKTVHVYHAGGSGFEWEADESAVRDAQSTLNDTIRNNRKEDEIEKLNKLKEAVQKNNELIGSSFEDYEKKKKYLAEFDKMTYEEMVSYNETWKDSILGNMKSTQTVTNVNNIISSLEKLLSTLETLNDVVKWISSGGESANGGGLTGLFGSGGLFNKIGKFFSEASQNGLDSAVEKSGEWFSGKIAETLEANSSNPIIKAFSSIWETVSEQAGSFFGSSESGGLLNIIGNGLKLVGEKVGGLFGTSGGSNILGQLATKIAEGNVGSGIVAKLFSGGATAAATTGTAGATTAVTTATTGTTLAAGASSIPVIGPIIALAVNNAVHQFSKISKENTKIWADENSSTGEKIIKSVGNVLYHLSPVEGWDLATQYAEKAANGDGIWEKLKYGAKSIYYGCGLGVVVDNILSTVKGILGFFGIKFSDSSDDVSTSSSTSDKKGIGSWKIWPWNWGKKAKGDKSIKKSSLYNVDEEGEEFIVRKPQTGRMTYLEKGDGVVPANETENLMNIGQDPIGWLTENVGKILGSSAAKDVVDGEVDEGAVIGASQEIADAVVQTFSSAWNSVESSTEGLIDSMDTSFQGGATALPSTAGTILGRIKTLFGKTSLGKILGGFTTGISKSVATGAKEFSSTSELISGTKSKTIEQMNIMKSTFEKTWNSVAESSGISKDKITSISSSMFSKMESLVNQTYDAIDSNAGMSADQVSSISQSLFTAMQNIYTSGWNSIYSTSTGMSQETADKLNESYKSSSDSCTSAFNTISQTLANSWTQCGGGVQSLANGTYQTLSNAWADSSGDAQKMLYDTRACFDSGWGLVEQGVSNLANNPKDKLSAAYAEITSKSNATFGVSGSLKADADNAWSNVEPGATNMASNMKWVMDQSYTAITDGCDTAVDSVNKTLGSTSSAFNAVETSLDGVEKKADEVANSVEKKKASLLNWLLNPMGTLADTVTGYDYTKNSTQNNILQNAVHAATHPIETAANAVGSVVSGIGSFIKGIFGHASGLKSAAKDHLANVDEQGPELLVRTPQSGRYTYLETGDGVVPADITSKLFEMGGNPNKWFTEQMSKYGSQTIATKSTGNTSFSTGNIIINNPVSNSEDLASEIKKNFSNKMAQEWNKR